MVIIIWYKFDSPLYTTHIKVGYTIGLTYKNNKNTIDSLQTLIQRLSWNLIMLFLDDTEIIVN